MAIINTLFSWYIKKRFHQIELFMKYPHEVQLELFKDLIYSAKYTEWGRHYDYQSINSLEDFKERVPINSYEDLKPYIDRLRKGEQNILWPSEVRYFAKSSGTSNNRSKYIPVTQESLEECHYKGGKDMLSIYCNNNPNSVFFDGKGLALGGSQQINEVNNQEYYAGDLSAIIIDNLPFWAEFIRVPKRSVALMDNWELKIEKIASSTIEQNITNLSGVPSWTLLLLKKVLEISGKDNILEVWPNLEVFFHGGVNFEPYRIQFQKIIPSKDMIYMNTYNASEGFFGIQDSNKSDEMLLMLDYGIYYEFIAVDQLTNEHPKTLALYEISLNTNYAMVISTNCGLWRYMIGDTVEFTNLSPYKIKITGRTKNFINAFGEELIIDNAEKALAKVCQQTDSVINEYTAAPVYFDDHQNGAHQWIIEFEKEPKNLKEFTNLLDQHLKSTNSDYEAKRYRDLILRKPIIQCVSKGTYYKWMKKRGKLGGQNKVPRLYNDRTYVDEILKFH